jgi:hypothetical protein
MKLRNLILLVILMAQPVLLRYTLGTKTVEIPAHYAQGLGGAFVSGAEKGAVQFVSYDPLWKDVYQTADSLTSQQSLTVSMIAGRVDGTWSALENPGNTDIRAMAIGPDRTLYVAGGFTDWDSIANADYIVSYSSSTWAALGTGADAIIYALAIGPDGTLYAGGNFANIGGVAATKVASWDGSTWTALSTGVTDGAVTALALNSTGKLYAAGAFATINGVAAADHIAYWDGSTWTAVSSGAFTGTSVDALIFDTSDNLYAGGNFSKIGGVSASNIAMWDGSAWNALGTGTNDVVYALELLDTGALIAGGAFSTAGGTTVNLIGKWNGTTWSALGDGITGTDVRDLLYVSSTGDLYVSGNFTAAGGLTAADYIAVWDGTSWGQIDIDLPGTPVVYAMAWDLGDLYIGYDTSGTATTGNTATITNNGSAPAYPEIKVKRSGGTSATIEALVNETSGKQILFNLSLLDGETVTIDLSPWAKSVTSDYQGNRLGEIVDMSDLATWSLLPGDNTIRFYVSDAGSPTITATMRWRQQFWSVDDA